MSRRVFLVGGAGGGVGLFLAPQLHAWGWEVIGVDFQQQFERRIAEGETRGEHLLQRGVRLKWGDLSREDFCLRLVEEIIDEYGDLHDVICLCGKANDSFALNKPVDVFQDVVHSHVVPLFAMATAAGRYWKRLKQAKALEGMRTCIGISSVNAFRQCDGQADYAPSKAFIEAMTRQIGGEWLAYFEGQVSMVALAFGYINAGMLSAVDLGIRDDLNAFGGIIELPVAAEAVRWVHSMAHYLNGTTVPFYANAQYLERRAYAGLCQTRRQERKKQAAPVIVLGNGNGNGAGISPVPTAAAQS